IRGRIGRKLNLKGKKMKWFYNLKIGAKLILSFIVVSSITGLIGYYGIDGMGTINGMLNTIYENHLLGISDNKEANINLINYDRALRNYILARDQEDRDKRLSSMQIYESNIRQNLEKVGKGLVTV